MRLIEPSLRTLTRLAYSQPMEVGLTTGIARSAVPEVKLEDRLVAALEGKAHDPGKKERVDEMRRRDSAWFEDNPSRLWSVDRRTRYEKSGMPLYRFHCRCGKTGYLTMPGIKARHRAGLGCALPGCDTWTIRHRIWVEPVAALRAQAVQLMALYWFKMPPEWEGLSVEDATMGLSEMLKGRMDVEQGKWWINGIDVADGLEEGSVRLEEVPDLSLFPAGELSIRLDAEAVPLSEAALTFGVPEEQLLDMRLRWFDNQLIDKLLEMRYEKRF